MWIQFKDDCYNFVCQNGIIGEINVCQTASTQMSQSSTAFPTVGCSFNGVNYENGQIWYSEKCLGHSCYLGVVHDFNNCNNQCHFNGQTLQARVINLTPRLADGLC